MRARGWPSYGRARKRRGRRYPARATGGGALLDSYHDVFTARGEAYHEAMTRWPEARAEELRLLVDRLAPRAGELLVDAPAGGGYLAAHLPDGVRYVAVEAAQPFFARCPEDAGHARLLCPLAKIDLPDASADVVTSLAGLHHEPDVDGVLAELVRVLRPGGRLGVADVRRGSAPDRFLDGFVHAHSRLGHRGRFFDATLADRLREAGLREVTLAPAALRWRFPDVPAMVAFVRLLFGIDRAGDGEIRAALESILGVEPGAGGGVALRWELLVATGRKAS
jgi:SAM-dependent methyltransferase